MVTVATTARNVATGLTVVSFETLGKYNGSNSISFR